MRKHLGIGRELNAASQSLLDKEKQFPAACPLLSEGRTQLIPYEYNLSPSSTTMSLSFALHRSVCSNVGEAPPE